MANVVAKLILQKTLRVVTGDQYQTQFTGVTDEIAGCHCSCL
jgi:hypothetical protein